MGFIVKEFFNKHDFLKACLFYTILFILMVITVYGMFFVKDKSFIWNSDGLEQHYIILYDFNEYVRGISSEGISLWSWEMGLGSDIIGQYAYYIIGDPFSYISLLFPMDMLEFAYNFLIILRIFCVGLAFLAFIRKFNVKGNSAIIGALMYAFSGWILFSSIRHPYFTNAAILLPLLLFGIEKLLRKESVIPLIILAAISTIVNYYFSYMLAILIFIYAVIRYLDLYKKEKISSFLKMIGKGIRFLLCPDY